MKKSMLLSFQRYFKNKTSLASVGIFIALIAFIPLFSLFRLGFIRAASASVILKIKLQGEHFAPNSIPGEVVFFNNKKGEVKKFDTVEFVLKPGGIHEALITLDSSIPLSAFYAISVKPKGYLSRLFCSSTASGSACLTPQFILRDAINAIDLTSQSFAGGDVEPYSGTIDAYDISNVITDLGKVGLNLRGDVTGDGVVNTIDYSVTLSSLLFKRIADPIPQSILVPPSLAPTQNPTVTITAAPSTTISPTVIISPTSIYTPTATPSLTPTAIPTPTYKPSLTPTPKPTTIPSPTSLPKLGKICKNGTTKITKSINTAWDLNVLPIPYGKPEYICIQPQHIVLHWSDSPNFLGNSATWGTLNSRNIVCGLAIDNNAILQMSNFYDDKITWEGCSTLEDSINIEINGTQFDLWYDANCEVVNPKNNKALAAGELQRKKEKVASEYGVSISTLDWENQKYVTFMESQEKKVLDSVKYLMKYYSIPLSGITGHNKIAQKDDPGERFLTCIKKKLE